MYAKASDLLARYSENDLRQLSDPSAAVIDDAVLERALSDASAEIDGYLVGQYVLPLAKVPAVLTRMACEIAMYRLLAMRPQDGFEDQRKRYEDVVRFLEKVAKGDINLSLDAIPVDASKAALARSAPRRLRRDQLAGW
jgi:phage gp36-like protein